MLQITIYLAISIALSACSKGGSDSASSQVSSVTSVTSTVANGTYAAGQLIPIQIIFNKPVTVNGTPQLILETGCTDTTINYASGSGTETLLFNYTVQNGDQNLNLDYTSTTALSLNGGTISDTLGMAATLNLPSPGNTHSLSNNKAITISTTPINSANNFISGTPGTTGRQDVLYTFTPNLLTTGIVFTGANLPSWLSVNNSTGVLTGAPDASATHSNIYLCASKNGDTQTLGPFSISVTGDPIKSEAWHLKNTGQKAFSQSGGTVGADLNLNATISEGITGNGVKIAISDSGTQIAHEDLADRLIPNASKNYKLSSPWVGDPTPSDLTTSGIAHGTAVAGIAAGTGWNNKGSRGVAPLASFAAFLFIGGTQSGATFVDQAAGDFDIFNYSYGYDSCEYTPINASLKTQLETGTTTLRGGKGALYVKASGNEYIGDLGNCIGALSGHGYYGNSNWDGINSRYEVIVVGALNANGVATTYSSPGSNVWISTPGGQFGTTSPAIISTDLVGCTHGFSRTTNTANSFESGNNSLNSSCDYTSTMNGTSSATPNTSGAIALLLEANPNLTWRDVKYILAKSAERVDPSSGNSPHPGKADLANHVYQQGWVQNAAGVYFHNQYGFGAVDVDAAVAMAKTYNSALGTLSRPEFTSGSISLAIPDEIATGVTSTLNVTDNLKIESVEITLSIEHTYPSDLGIELYSPSRTKSIIININSNFQDGNLTDAHLISNAFLDELSQGTWSLKIIDGAVDDTGTLTNWKLKINGHATIIANKKGTPFEKAPLFTLFDALKFYFTAS